MSELSMAMFRWGERVSNWRTFRYAKPQVRFARSTTGWCNPASPTLAHRPRGIGVLAGLFAIAWIVKRRRTYPPVAMSRVGRFRPVPFRHLVPGVSPWSEGCDVASCLVMPSNTPPRSRLAAPVGWLRRLVGDEATRRALLTRWPVGESGQLSYNGNTSK